MVPVLEVALVDPEHGRHGENLVFVGPDRLRLREIDRCGVGRGGRRCMAVGFTVCDQRATFDEQGDQSEHHVSRQAETGRDRVCGDGGNLGLGGQPGEQIEAHEIERRRRHPGGARQGDPVDRDRHHRRAGCTDPSVSVDAAPFDVTGHRDHSISPQYD